MVVVAVVVVMVMVLHHARLGIHGQVVVVVAQEAE